MYRASASYQCLEITIYHTFRAPLEFDTVGSDVWDTKRNAWQNYYNHGIHITGESLNPVPGVLVNNGTLRLYPLIEDSIHVTVMVDENNDLYRLTPEGDYRPLQNIYELFHEIDDSMYLTSDMPKQGYDRGDSRFAQYLSEQIDLAQDLLDIRLGRQITNDAFYNMSNDNGNTNPFDQKATQRANDAALQAAILDEQSKAKELFDFLFDVK